MFLPHIYNKELRTFRPIRDGVQSSRFYQILSKFQRPGEEQFTDSWDRFFNTARMLYDNHMNTEEACNTMCDIMMTRDRKMRLMVKKHFSPEDYFSVRNHMIGTGMIGGKACGMLLSRAIVRNLAWDINEVLEPHDSFFIGSDVYYTYIVDNGFWDIRVRQREETEYFSLAEEFARRLKNGVFSEEMKKSFFYIFWNIMDRILLLCVPAVFWRMASETHLQENMNLFFAQIVEAWKNALRNSRMP